jgi:AraC-like DNA-binding protein
VTEINYTNLDYISFIETIAAKLNTKVKDNFLKIPANFGEGYIWAENFSNGISFFVAEITFTEDVMMQRISGDDGFLILHFNELIDSPENNIADKDEKDSLRKNAAFLSTTFLGSRYIFPAGCKVKSCSILFEKKHLLKIVENKVADNFISLYFSEYFKHKKIEPIDANYRTVMNELIKENITHPFRHLFIQNRIMLLIERFLINYLEKENSGNTTLKLSEEEISRLMKVEAMLVKNFEDTPPVIEVLARFSSMSPTKLKKDFKALYHMPIYEYYQKNRMLHAKSLLLENKYAIKEVGRMVGYTNLGHFAASFKKEFNLLPKNITRVDESEQMNEEISLPKAV